MDEGRYFTRNERRAEKRRKQHARMAQHGKGLARVYRDAVTKRLQKPKGK